jgi:hypothetical protein
MTDFILKRTTFTTRSTIGELWYYKDDNDTGIMVCYILEDEARADGVKIPGVTAIPAGEYKIKVTYSNRFKRDLPIIYNMDDLSIQDGAHRWDGVRMHPGNSDVDTEACQLPGTSKALDIVYESGKALNDKLYPLIVEALKNKTELSYKIINQQA